jgi:hypothetical protein
VGGITVTITGQNFRNNSSGTAPSVLFGSTSATSVVVVNTTTITCTVPAALVSGTVNVTVTIDSQSDTLTGAFLYYETVVFATSPSYGPFAGGTQIEIQTYNVDTTGTFQVSFGATLGTNLVVVDAEHLIVTTPAHAVGFVDVILQTSPGGVEVARLRNGFQFTQLTRIQSIRRTPGIIINDALNNRPNTCSFSVDGSSNKPIAGEQINIIDTFDGSRVLFAGNVQRVDQEYEGQISQLVWRVSATDFTSLFNRRRPTGTYFNTSVSDIVKDLVGKFAPGFGTSFVQSNLAIISIKFDGSRDFATCLSDLAQAIGGGHWYVDYTPTLHFFHVPPHVVKPISPIRPGPGSALTPAESATYMPNTQSFATGYYYFRTTFIYSNGTESSLSPASVVVTLTGSKQIALSNIPIGVNPGGGITVTGRRIYFVRGTQQLRRGWKINDNVTAAVTVYPGMPSTATITDESRLTVTISLPPPSPPPPPAPAAAIAPAVVAGAAIPFARFSSGTWHFTLAAVYSNGFQTAEGPASNTIVLTTSQGPHFTILPAYPAINGVNPIGYQIFAYHHTSIGVMQTGLSFTNGAATTLGLLPYTPTTATNPLPPTAPAVIPQVNFGDKPRQPTSAQPSFTWPNNDGPYLENASPPADVNDASTLLLRDPEVTSSEDISQLRNRVIVHGASTSVTVDANIGATEVEVADVSIFNELGGTVLISGSAVNYTSPSSQTPGQGSLFLESDCQLRHSLVTLSVCI